LNYNNKDLLINNINANNNLKKSVRDDKENLMHNYTNDLDYQFNKQNIEINITNPSTNEDDINNKINTGNSVPGHENIKQN